MVQNPASPRCIAGTAEEAQGKIRWLRPDFQNKTATQTTIAHHFTKARKDRVEELLQTLVALGQAREISAGQFLAG